MNRFKTIAGLVAVGMITPIAAQAGTSVYGKIHMSADVMDIGAGGGHGVSSNSSRIGFKGKTDLNYGLKAIWKLETELDVAGDDTAKFKSRNRYLGLNYKKSTLVGGYHDTPFKTLGGKSGVLHDTIADRRGILGRDYLSGDAANDTGDVKKGKKIDVRAASAVMYINKSITNTEFRLMRSAGSGNASAGDTSPITSASVMYKTSQIMLGGAYEEQEAKSTSGIRLLGGIAFGATRVNATYEKLDFGDTDAKAGWDRSVIGLSATHKLGATSIKAQTFIAQDLDSQSDSGARMYAAGVYHKLAKAFEVYTVVARLENDENSAYTLTGSGHGDSYYPSSKGGNMHGLSFGAIYKF